MSGSREPSHPPSDPHVLGARPAGNLFAPDDRSIRWRFGAALLVGVVLVATGLYLWRRPHSVAERSTEESASATAAAMEPPPPAPAPDAGASPLMLSDARVLGCHDRGPRVTPPEQCDHVAPIEKALSAAVEQAAACVPPTAGGGTIEYVADVSFLHRRVNVTLPHAGRSVRDRKVLRACAAAVRGAMQLTQLDGMDHQHAQYKIAVTATYKQL